MYFGLTVGFVVGYFWKSHVQEEAKQLYKKIKAML